MHSDETAIDRPSLENEAPHDSTDDYFEELALPLDEVYERHARADFDPDEIEEPGPGYRVVSQRGVFYARSRGEGDCEGSGFRGWRVVDGVPEPTDWGACPNRAKRFGLCGPCAAYAERLGIEHVARGEREFSTDDEEIDGLEPLPAHGHRSHVEIKHADIRRAYAQGRTQRELATALQMSERQIRRIVKGVKRVRR
jgi:hypothetical protein